MYGMIDGGTFAVSDGHRTKADVIEADDAIKSLTVPMDGQGGPALLLFTGRAQFLLPGDSDPQEVALIARERLGGVTPFETIEDVSAWVWAEVVEAHWWDCARCRDARDEDIRDGVFDGETTCDNHRTLTITVLGRSASHPGMPCELERSWAEGQAKCTPLADRVAHFCPRTGPKDQVGIPDEVTLSDNLADTGHSVRVAFSKESHSRNESEAKVVRVLNEQDGDEQARQSLMKIKAVKADPSMTQEAIDLEVQRLVEENEVEEAAIRNFKGAPGVGGVVRTHIVDAAGQHRTLDEWRLQPSDE
jgi:hypothetical protein